MFAWHACVYSVHRQPAEADSALLLIRLTGRFGHLTPQNSRHPPPDSPCTRSEPRHIRTLRAFWWTDRLPSLFSNGSACLLSLTRLMAPANACWPLPAKPSEKRAIRSASIALL